LSDFAADLRAPTPSAAAELVSESFFAAADAVRSVVERLEHGVRARLEKARLLLKPFGAEDMEYRFRAILQPRLIRLDDAKDALIDSMRERCAALRSSLNLASAVLEAGSPQAVMERGFSVVTNVKGEVIRDAGAVKKGDMLRIRPRKGSIHAVTLSTEG
jgi:exodeoxyribonuclease VII large subunit